MRFPSRIRTRPAIALNAIAGLILLQPVLPNAPNRSLDMRVPFAPRPVTVNEVTRLVYELHLTSYARDAVRVQTLSVLDAPDGAIVAELDDEALTGALARFDAQPDGDPLTIRAGSRAVVYLEVDLASVDARTPRALVHRIEFTEGGMTQTLSGGHTRTDDAPLPVLAPPVRGGPWVAIYHPSWPRGHRRVYYAVDGRARLPGRFAVDWVLADADGHNWLGERDVVANWFGHGVEVLAVADARVAAVRDDMPESDRMSTRQHPAQEDATGNYIALDLGDGRFVFYEHLKPGSIRVAPGERVRSGDVIAALGFTGSTGLPHLHFHVADANAPLGAEGVPFALECFELVGAYDGIDSMGIAPWAPSNGVRRGELPAPNVVVDFRCSNGAR